MYSCHAVFNQRRDRDRWGGFFGLFCSADSNLLTGCIAETVMVAARGLSWKEAIL